MTVAWWRRPLVVLAIGVAVGLAGLPAAGAEPAGHPPVPVPVLVQPEVKERADFGVVSVDEDTLLVGAPLDSAPPRTGAAYVFVASGGDWVQQARLLAPDGVKLDFFGVSVAVDGDTALVGANHADPDGVFNSGSAYVFVRSGSTWTLQAELAPSVRMSGAEFGFAVALRGGVAVVSAIHGGVDDKGAVSIFTRSGTSWTEQALLEDPEGHDPREPYSFGTDLAIDGSTIAVGASSPVGDQQRSAAYVYVGAGDTWTRQAVLTSGAPAGTWDGFGAAVGLDGDTIVVGARSDETSGLKDSGSVYVFTRSGSDWSETAQLLPRKPNDYSEFGSAVAVAGGRIATSSLGFGPSSVHLFRQTGSGWRETPPLKPPTPAERFGVSLDIDRTASGQWTLAVGATEREPGGAAYIYRP